MLPTSGPSKLPPQALTMSTNSSPVSADVASFAYLRRRSGQQEAFNNGGSSVNANQSIASRRPSAHNALQNDFSLTLTSLTDQPNSPVQTRPTTPSISANSPVSPFGKQRAAAEIQAVVDMVASNDIQRPASAPPRGPRSRHTSKEHLDDFGTELMEAAQLGHSNSPSTDLPLSIKETALDVMNILTSSLSDRSLALLFLFIVIWGAVLSLDRLTTYSYQTIAANSFSSHSSLAMVNVIRAVVAAVAAIPFAVVADLFGRYQAFTIALASYAVGHIIMAASTNVSIYVAGIIFYEIGANALVCLQYTVMADVTSSRNRLFFQILPQMPFLVFSFISSDIYSAILPRWRWGIGMFAILGPVSLFPVVWILHTSQRGQKSAAVSSTLSLRRATIQQKSSSLVRIFLCLKHLWILADLFGLLLLAASLSLILVPLTLAAKEAETWENPKILGMISAGAVLGFMFGYWEAKKASNPFLPKLLLGNRTFWGGGISLCLLWSAHALMIAYFPTYLYVVHNTSNRAQQNISVVYSFTVAASLLPVALVVRYSRRYKVFALIGVMLFTAGLGLMIGFHSSSSIFRIVISQIVIGLGGAMTIALIQAAVQVSVPHAHVAQSIAVLNIFPCLGNAIGAAVAGVLWSNLLPSRLIKDLASSGHQSDVHNIYAEPLTWIESYPIGTSARTGVLEAYSSIWTIMMMTATIICATSALSTLWMKNLKLDDFASVVEDGDKRAGNPGEANVAIKENLFGDRLLEKLEHALWKRFGRRNVYASNEHSVSESKSTLSDGDDKKTGRHRFFSHSKSNNFDSNGHDISSSSNNNASTENKIPSEDVFHFMPPVSLAPILIIDHAPDDNEPNFAYSAPAGPSSGFRSPHSVARSSPLAQKSEGDSFM